MCQNAKRARVHMDLFFYHKMSPDIYCVQIIYTSHTIFSRIVSPVALNQEIYCDMLNIDEIVLFFMVFTLQNVN